MFYYVCFNSTSGGLYSFASNNAIICPDGYVVEERESDDYPSSKSVWSVEERKFNLPEQRIITKLEFLSRLSGPERIMIREAAKTNPILDDIMTLLDLAENIDLDDARLQQSVGYMTTVGLIEPARLAEILG
jgi:hypothetical protein